MDNLEEAIMEIGQQVTQAVGDLNKRMAEVEQTVSYAKRKQSREEIDASRPAVGVPEKYVGGVQVSGFRGAKQERAFSLRNAILGQLGAPGVDDGYERECSKEIAHRHGKGSEAGIFVPLQTRDANIVATPTLVDGVPVGGSNLVGTSHLGNSFIDVLRARSIVMAMGPMLLPNLVGNVAIPRKTSGSTAYWTNLDDDDTITASGIAFDSLTLTPHSVGGLAKFSHRMLMQSDPGIEALVSADLAATLSEAIDRAAFVGSTPQPTGILATAGIGSDTWTNGSDPEWADIVGLETALAEANADLGNNLAYVTTPALRGVLKATPKVSGDASGGFLWEPGNTMNGLPAHATNNMGAGKILLGNWSDLVVGMWGAMQILVNPYLGGDYEKGNVAVRAIMDVDFGLRHAASFAEIHEAAA